MQDQNENILEARSTKTKCLPENSTEGSKNCSSSSSSEKRCVECGTSKTPLWRVGPAGPKSLCNACGIRSRKKRRMVIGGGGCGGHDRDSEIGESLKQRVLNLRRAVMRKRSRKLGEEEKAAVLLMALSYASPVYV